MITVYRISCHLNLALNIIMTNTNLFEINRHQLFRHYFISSSWLQAISVNWEAAKIYCWQTFNTLCPGKNRNILQAIFWMDSVEKYFEFWLQFFWKLFYLSSCQWWSSLVKTMAQCLYYCDLTLSRTISQWQRSFLLRCHWLRGLVIVPW